MSALACSDQLANELAEKWDETVALKRATLSLSKSTRVTPGSVQEPYFAPIDLALQP
jgi:hypothetical protein